MTDLRTAVPCGDLIATPVAEDRDPKCAAGHDLAHCGPTGGCEHYVPGLTALERTRCEVWTRVMGYHRPVHAFNAGKRAEHAERRYFVEPTTGLPVIPTHRLEAYEPQGPHNCGETGCPVCGG
jgi:hypothetical protein